MRNLGWHTPPSPFFFTTLNIMTEGVARSTVQVMCLQILPRYFDSSVLVRVKETFIEILELFLLVSQN